MLIDTQIIIWLATGREALLTPAAKKSFREADELFLSLASYWEIAVKRGVRKVQWDDRETETFQHGLRQNRISDLGITRAHCEQVVLLPRHHRDPFDRMLIAQAQVERLAILTSDKYFRKYDVRVVW
ncbi:MAG TPA: type II toxin-antitoxin system VapC family toxin [Chthoniobacterales bacterium]